MPFLLITCSNCNGRGQQTLFGKPVTCRVCHGNGHHHIYTPAWAAGPPSYILDDWAEMEAHTPIYRDLRRIER